MKRMKLFFMLLVLTGMLAFTSCDTDSNAENAREDVEQMGDEISADIQNEQQEVRADIEEMKRDINDKIADLESNLDNASAETTQEVNEQIAKLKSWNNTLDERLNRMGDDMEDGWNDFRLDVENTLSEIEQNWDATFDSEG